jgi:hypothetical protein
LDGQDCAQPLARLLDAGPTGKERSCEAKDCVLGDFLEPDFEPVGLYQSLRSRTAFVVGGLLGAVDKILALRPDLVPTFSDLQADIAADPFATGSTSMRSINEASLGSST